MFAVIKIGCIFVSEIKTKKNDNSTITRNNQS
jgi:hypothetical protein